MPRTAPRWATWERRGGRIAGALPTQAAPSSGVEQPEFPDVPFATVVELLIDGVWTDVTEFVFGGGRDRVTIVRGRGGEGSVADRSTCKFSLNNRDGQFSPRNPIGPHYGFIGRNTPCRVSVTRTQQRYYRFFGEVPAWPQSWDTTGTDVWVPVEASGVMRRLGTGAAPLKSALYRAYTTLEAQGRSRALAYWPMEDAVGSTSIASAVDGVRSMRINFGAPDLAVSTEFDCSAALLQLNNCVLHGDIPGHAGTGAVQVRWLLAIPEAGTTNGAIFPRVQCVSDAPRWDIVYSTGGSLTIKAYDSDGSNILDTGPTAFALNGKLLLVSFELEAVGVDIEYALSTLEVGASEGLSMSGTLSSRYLDRIKKVHMGDGAPDDVTVGHLVVQSEITPLLDQSNELAAWAGEVAGRRIERLCMEEGVALHATGDLDDTERMGPQRQDNLLALVRDAEAVDAGILYEPRHTAGLAYRTRIGMYNQSASLTLDYPSHELSTLEPTDDDLATRNDVTASRAGGSSSRVVLEDGPLSVQDPPDGVGRYDEAVTVNVQTDGMLRNQSGWRVRLGTVDEPRYPTIGMNLANQALLTDDALTVDVIEIDVGDEITVTNSPTWLPPGDIAQLVVGTTEDLENFDWRINAVCTPASAWAVAVYDAARYSPDSSALTVPVAAGGLSLSVATDDGPLWTTAGEDFPMDLKLGGEVITISAISGTSSPQTFTVSARSVNGVTKGHAPGTAVELAEPAYYALG